MGFFIIIMGTVCFLSKIIWCINRYIPLINTLQKKVISPDEPEFTLGNIVLEKGLYEASEEKFRLSSKILPNKAATYANIALCLMMQCKRNLALIEIEKAISIEPKNELFKHSKRQIQKGKINRILNQNGTVVKDFTEK